MAIDTEKLRQPDAYITAAEWASAPVIEFRFDVENNDGSPVNGATAKAVLEDIRASTDHHGLCLNGGFRPLRTNPDPAAQGTDAPSEGAKRITAERRRQVAEEDWTPEHDDDHVNGELTDHAAALVSSAAESLGLDEWGLTSKHRDPIRRLEIAGALIAAEIDRLLRTNPDQEGGE